MSKTNATPPLDPADFTARFAAAARAAGFREEKFGEIEGHPLLAYTKPAAAATRRIYLSAGIHGDEPAPPWTLLRLLQDGLLDDRASWFVCPLLNPLGFLRQVRENQTGLDLNRDYKALRSEEIQAHVDWLRRQPGFDLAICVHEDWEAKGFYLYELNHQGRPTLAHAMLDAARTQGPIETATVIDDRAVSEPGIIRPVSDPLLRETWPESIYLRQHHATLLYTIESPSGLPLEQRIAMLSAALTAALGAFLT